MSKTGRCFILYVAADAMPMLLFALRRFCTAECAVKRLVLHERSLILTNDILNPHIIDSFYSMQLKPSTITLKLTAKVCYCTLRSLQRMSHKRIGRHAYCIHLHSIISGDMITTLCYNMISLTRRRPYSSLCMRNTVSELQPMVVQDRRRTEIIRAVQLQRVNTNLSQV